MIQYMLLIRKQQNKEMLTLSHDRFSIFDIFEYRSDKIMFDAFSPIIITGALVFPVVNVGIMDASATRSPPTP